MNPPEQELLDQTQRLLNSIAEGDWDTYTSLCDASLTAFEPEALGHLVEGLPFHHFYFQQSAASGDDPPPKNTTISSPHVRLLSDAVAVVCYIRLMQVVDPCGAAKTIAFEETRVWQKLDGRWKHVHFHRSQNNLQVR